MKYGPGDVLIASLTRAAAEEVGGRDTGVYPDRIGTLHAHAFRALDRPAIAEGPEGRKAWNAYVERHGLGNPWKMDPGSGVDDPEWKPAEAKMRGIGVASGDTLLQTIGVYRARMTPQEIWNPTAARFHEHWERFKKTTFMLDFTDLIADALRDVDRPPGEPKVMMLDEAQDMSRLEMMLARKWGATCEQSVTVGDPDQCLYSWRGTEADAMTDQDFASRNVLSRSYRVPAAVHAYAMEWINRIPDREPVEYKPRLEDPEDTDGPEAQGEVRRTHQTWRRPHGAIDLIEADLQEGKTAMILTSCTYMLDPTVHELRERGIPFHNPYRPQHGGWNPMRGARRLLTYLSPSAAVHGEQAHEWTWRDVFVWLGPMRAQGLLVRGSKTKVEKMALEHPDVQPGIDELQDLFVSPTEFVRALQMDVPWWVETLLADAKKVQRYPAQIYAERGPEALAKRPRLVVGTIHSVKGGEADSVYVFPDLSRAGWEDSWENRMRRAPTYRLFYVAFTRARERLTLCSGLGDYQVNFPVPE